MKILFINPKHHPHSMNFVHCMDIVGVKYSHLPLSLPTLAALTPRDCAIELIDENVEPVPHSTDAEIIALTGSVPQRKRVFELIDEFKRQGKFVAIGGPITFDMLDECSEHADAVFVGEAEYTWPQFIADYRQKDTRKVYHQKEFINMEDSPVPLFHLLKSDQYASACIQVTRGCPNRCDFCDIHVKYGGQPRSKKISQALEEIRALSNLGHDSIFIVDDNFAGNRPYAKALLKEIAAILPSLPTKMYFYTQATLDVANDEELLALMQAAEFRRLFIGVETGEKDELRVLNKRHQSEMDAKRAVEKIRSYGITVWAGIMFGLEGDDASAFEKRIQFILDADLIPVQVGLLQAIPGTTLYQRAEDEKRLLKLPSILGLTALSEEELSKGTNLVHSKMSGEELEKNFAKALKTMFSPEVFEIKMTQYLGSGTRGLKSSAPALNFKTVMIVARLLNFYIFRAGGPSRKMFFNVILKLISKKMQSLDEVVFHLLAYKHIRTHYYRIAEICESRR